MSQSTLRPWGALATFLCLWLLLQAPAASADDLVERFATARSTWTAKVSLDGKHVALGCTRRDVPAVCVYELDSTSKPPIVVNAPPGHLLQHFSWLDHGWLLMRVQESVYHRSLHRWSGVYDDVATNIFTQKSRVLAAVDWVAAIPAATPDMIVYRSGAGIVRFDLASGEQKLERFDDSIMCPMHFLWHDGRGEPVLALRSNQDFEKLFVIRGPAGAEVPLDATVSKSSPEDLRFLGFTDGGDKLATLGYFGGDRLQFQLFDSATGKRLPLDPALEGLQFDTGIIDVASEELVGLRYSDDMPRQKFLDPKLERIQTTVAKALPGANVEILSWSRDRSLATIEATTRARPAAFYLFDRTKGTVSPLGSTELADLPPSQTTAIEYTARDGLKIEAFLTVPASKQTEQKPLPLILMPHDGPYHRTYADYDWWVEYFAQRGYAVLRPNYRGSNGYGRAFSEKGHGEFGGAIIDDIIDGARFAAASGLVDRNRVCAVGIGYGGYAALMAGLREPSLVKCIVAVNTISDAVTVLGNTQRFYSGQSFQFKFWEKYIGNRYDSGAAAAMSPARSAADIRPPVLLLHDTRTNGSPVTQSRYLKEQMDLYERDAKLIEFDADDSGLVTAKSRRVILTESDAFLAKYLQTQ